MQKATRWLRDNGLVLVFFGLFFLSLSGQAFTGFRSHNQALRDHGRPPAGFLAYLGTGDFLDGVFSNWQAAFLQLGSLIVFSCVLRQRGASHSRKPGSRGPNGARPSVMHRAGARTRRPEARGDVARSDSWWYRNSLSLAFGFLFLFSFLAHAYFGADAENFTRSLQGEVPWSVAAYVGSPTFWRSTVQTWQAEFVAIAVYLVLSIFLRQEGSAESKPVESSNEETGKSNE